jgi:hypothetical protein
MDIGGCDSGGATLMIRKLCLVLVFATALTACSQTDKANESEGGSEAAESAGPDYVVMGEDLQQLKDDFNANQGRVRLVFLSGPTCGICLRGMADLNDEFIAESQNEDRLVTFVVHVPTMGAKEHHAADSIPLLNGPRVHHYWEESGIIGQHYTEVMDVDMYVWDFWAIYGPDAVWEGTLPPVPNYYEHQLGVTSGTFRGFPKELVLDAERFAAETRKYLAQVDSSRFAADSELELTEIERSTDGTVIPHVGQPRNVAVRQHIMGRGGYKNLKRIRSIEARGHIEVDGTSRALTIQSERPNVIRRLVGSGDDVSLGELNLEGVVTIQADVPRGLPGDLERRILETFEFDGLFVEWPDKGHKVDMIGMQKFGDVLAWQLELIQEGGPHWNLYVDSHTGDIVRAYLLDDNDEPMYIMGQSDFRETSGFMFPHRIEYMNGAGRTLAIETIDEIEVDVMPLELELETVTH